METRAQRIRQLQKEIRALEATIAKFGDSPTLQITLDSKKDELEHEKQLELQEINRPVVIQPSPRSWQDDIPRYLIITIIALIIAGIILFIITNSITSLGG
jgi:hypothetical protein